MKKFLCKIFGHYMIFDSCNVAGPSTCKWCGHKKPGIVWPRCKTEDIILDAMTRFLEGVYVELDDPSWDSGRKKIKKLSFDKDRDEVKIVLEDGTWNHSDFLIISKDQL